MVKTIRPEWLNTERINILRWEDDGGKIIDPPFVQPMPMHGAMPDTSLPWNQQFVIEPFQADAGIRSRLEFTDPTARSQTHLQFQTARMVFWTLPFGSPLPRVPADQVLFRAHRAARATCARSTAPPDVRV